LIWNKLVTRLTRIFHLFRALKTLQLSSRMNELKRERLNRERRRGGGREIDRKILSPSLLLSL
jgi:hypothetical protein